MEYAITEQMDIKEWAELLASSKDATFFHTYEWMKLLHENSTYNQQLFITARNETGKLMGWMPFVIIIRKKVVSELVSLPNSASGGVVIVDDVNEHTRETLRENILKAFCDFGKRFSYTRILNRVIVVDFLNNHGFLASNGFRRKSNY